PIVDEQRIAAPGVTRRDGAAGFPPARPTPPALRPHDRRALFQRLPPRAPVSSARVGARSFRYSRGARCVLPWNGTRRSFDPLPSTRTRFDPTSTHSMSTPASSLRTTPAAATTYR